MMNRINPATSAFLVLVILCGLAGGTCAQTQKVQEFDIVPPSWLTADRLPGESGSNASTADAYVFPSLGSSDQPAAITDLRLDDFFAADSHYRERQTFPYQPAGLSSPITVTMYRKGNETSATVTIDAASMAAIRQLSWKQFNRLQVSFASWVCKESRSWFLGDCRKAFQKPNQGLLKLWIDNALKDSAFSHFAAKHFDTTFASPIGYTGGIESLKKPVPAEKTEMLVMPVEPNQIIAVTWANENLYPTTPDGFRTAYSRILSGATSEITAISDEGMSLFPRARLNDRAGHIKPCTMEAVAEDERMAPPPPGLGPGPAPAVLSPRFPYPAKWLGKVFIPVYSLFDLHNSAVLTKIPVVGREVPQAGAAQEEPAAINRDRDKPREAAAVQGEPAAAPQHVCEGDTRIAPKYLFLLVPSHYIKADLVDNGGPAQFQHESRAQATDSPAKPPDTDGKNNVADEVYSLPRQFFLLACDPPDRGKDLIADVQLEWNRILETASVYSAAPVGEISAGNCGNFMHASFPGSSVALRNHFSFNGRPVEHGAPNFQTIGQTLAMLQAAHLDSVGQPGSPPLLELWRLSSPQKTLLEANKLHLRFHTTRTAVLDQAEILEGDELYAGSISEVSR